MLIFLPGQTYNALIINAANVFVVILVYLHKIEINCIIEEI